MGILRLAMRSRGSCRSRRSRHHADRRDFREGFEFEGRWWTPDDVHRMCAARMEMVDQLPVELRAKLNRDGRL